MAYAGTSLCTSSLHCVPQSILASTHIHLSLSLLSGLAVIVQRISRTVNTQAGVLLSLRKPVSSTVAFYIKMRTLELRWIHENLTA